MSGEDRLQLAGVGTAIITPFTADGSAVDFDALTKLVESQLEDGIKFLVPCGTTGECPTLSKDEQIAVISRVVEIVNGRIPVVAGTGSNSTAKTVEMTLAAKKAGADAALVVCPYYNKPSQAGLYNHFATVAKEAGLPIVLYNIPGRTGINMQPETVARLYNDFKEVCAIKEATEALISQLGSASFAPSRFSLETMR